ncbi:MAG: hypothetical protein EZS28_020131 [Streblomastix strix]|uniref:Uncharacterized protein n=1 Tax=Streblomastix strix TaxID=222440 RepID=A0A5J4VP77_9EUKA|nr:MAG: hypothetical protein EZS28_020131 [Streblomastix strix]
MQTEQEIQDAAKAIISFADTYTQNKLGKQNDQSEQESIQSLIDIISSLECLKDQMRMNKSYKSVIRIPKLYQSLSALAIFKIGVILTDEINEQRFMVRHLSGNCLWHTQICGDEQDQTELVRQGYGRMMSITFCTAGGKGEEYDQEIFNVLRCIYGFLHALHYGRNDYGQPSQQPLPLLYPVSLEQIEEEGAIEEIEAQMKTKGNQWSIEHQANLAKSPILNHFIN